MENSNLETPEKEKKSAQKRPSSKKKERSEKSHRQKEQMGQIKHLITIALACFLLIGCVLIISDVMSKNEEFEKINSGEFIEESDLIDETEQEYRAVSYFVENYYERYMAFAELNPDKSAEEVIWMVNANLDMPKYSYDLPVSDYNEVTVLINKYYKIDETYLPADLTTVDNQQLRQAAATAFIQMRNDALEEGIKLGVACGYRNFEEQNVLYSESLQNDTPENADRYTERPGYSEHHTGLAIDLAGTQEEKDAFSSTPEYTWVQANCHKYGFIIRYPDGMEHITGFGFQPWHIRYVGEEISNAMQENSIATYEEYYVKYLQ